MSESLGEPKQAHAEPAADSRVSKEIPLAATSRRKGAEAFSTHFRSVASDFSGRPMG